MRSLTYNTPDEVNTTENLATVTGLQCNNTPAQCRVSVAAGPFVKGRELDLSREAFSRLASCEAGLLKVKITILKND